MNQICNSWIRQLAVFLLSSVLFGHACNDKKAERKAEHTRQESVEPLASDRNDTSSKDVELFGGSWEEQPTPKAGIAAFYEYVEASLTYPEEAKANGIEGKVFVQFLVKKDGGITEVKTIKGYGCDEEAERIVKHANPWKPGKQRDR